MPNPPIRSTSRRSQSELLKSELAKWDGRVIVVSRNSGPMNDEPKVLARPGLCLFAVGSRQRVDTRQTRYLSLYPDNSIAEIRNVSVGVS